ncbi:MAG: hypothetical protein KDA57_10750 [Planctomycetales bacterium]|nr:hypothetical protein [Planctomycetales bacterium]
MSTGWVKAVLLVLLTAHVACSAVVEEESRYVDSYPAAASKKGLQVEMIDDALALGVKHAALNVDLSQLVDPESAGSDLDQPSWNYRGQEYRFRRRQIESLDARIKTLSDNGVVVHLILLVYQSGNEATDRLMLHPGYDQTAPNRLGAFNTVTEEGRAWLTAATEFLAERWSRPDRKFGRVAGYIVGNEVNSHWWWSNMGRVTLLEFADAYLEAVRLVHQAVRRQSSWARVYISLEHHWNMRYPAGDEFQSFPGREFVDTFARRAREDRRGDFDWQLAFHPYPENLFEPRFWNDATAEPTEDTPRITFKNLEVLTTYLGKRELLYEGKPRRIILSEQGFHTPEGPEGEAIQAAAYCYAYRKVEALEGIDAFILHRHVDHPHEGGLRLGLRRYDPGASEPRPKKKIYDCFRAADTSEWRSAFEFALPLVDIDDWDEL